jgi:hypothetical protein
MTGRLFMLACLLPLLGACNMAISETPLFANVDKANLTPRDGVWVSEDPECRFDSGLSENQWPSCATWIIVNGSKGEMLLRNGKGEAQEARFVIANGQPLIVQLLWRDDAKEDGKTFYVFFGLEPGPAGRDRSFAFAVGWEVKCGTKEPGSSDIKPYPGISPECRPSSAGAVRFAAAASRSTAEMAMSWRWLRPESR